VFNIGSNGDGTTIQGFTIQGPDSAAGININEADNCKIINNTITNCRVGVNVYHSNNVQISGNTIHYTGTEYSYGIYSDASSNLISGNTVNITGIGSGDSRGIHTWGDSHKISENKITVTSSGTGWSYGISINSNNGNGHDIEISKNIIYTSAADPYHALAIEFNNAFSNQAFGNNILGGRIANAGNDNHLNFNRIVGDSTIYSSSETFDALYNWFGSNTDPSSRISAFEGSTVNYSPWLMLKITASPSTIYTGKTSKIIADVYTDSNGIDHSADASMFFSGPEITFTTDLGNVGSKSITVPWTLGSAFTILRADEGIGVATLIAADIQTVQTTVNILQAPVIDNPEEPINNSENSTVEAASSTTNTVGMQETGIPIAGLILAILMLFSGLIMPKRK
jgi:parallel beta-helix repeat protein